MFFPRKGTLTDARDGGEGILTKTKTHNIFLKYFILYYLFCIFCKLANFVYFVYYIFCIFLYILHILFIMQCPRIRAAGRGTNSSEWTPRNNTKRVAVGSVAVRIDQVPSLP